jgi:hypothetical protein
VGRGIGTGINYRCRCHQKMGRGRRNPLVAVLLTTNSEVDCPADASFWVLVTWDILRLEPTGATLSGEIT